MFKRWQWYVFTVICAYGVFSGVYYSDNIAAFWAALIIWSVGSIIWFIKDR